jgi:two-component sensor histidine kinase
MRPWTEDFWRGWRGLSDPPAALVYGFAAFCLAVCTSLRWLISQVRPDTPFSLYFLTVVLAAVFGGVRGGLAASLGGGVLGFLVSFADAPVGAARLALFGIYLVIAGLIMWGIQHYRSIVAHYRDTSNRLIEEETYRKLVVDELQHRLKNKLSTVQAVVRQTLHAHPELREVIDGRIRALSATDSLISQADEKGCDIRDLLTSELGPYGSRFLLDGPALFLPAKLAVSLALAFHELATNAAKYGALSSPKGLLNISWTGGATELSVIWDETGGPLLDSVGRPGFGTKLLGVALSPFNGTTEVQYLAGGLRCTMRCTIPSQ